MLDAKDKSFHDELQAKVFKGNSKDRALNSDKIISKLEELKPLTQIEVSNFPEIPKTDMSETNSLLITLIEETKKPCKITLSLKLK